MCSDKWLLTDWNSFVALFDVSNENSWEKIKYILGIYKLWGKNSYGTNKNEVPFADSNEPSGCAKLGRRRRVKLVITFRLVYGKTNYSFAMSQNDSGICFWLYVLALTLQKGITCNVAPVELHICYFSAARFSKRSPIIRIWPILRWPTDLVAQVLLFSRRCPYTEPIHSNHCR